MLHISNRISIPLKEIDFTFMTAQGSGGQNVNKVATAVHLKFDINKSSLPVPVKKRLLARKDHRITSDGFIVIKAQRHRTREQNRRSALHRLQEIVGSVLAVPKKRMATRPSRAAKERRLQKKSRRSQVKTLRSKITE